MRRPARRFAAERLEDRTVPSVSFAPPTSYTVPSNGMAVAAGDFNGDGKPDAAISTSQGVTTFINDGTGGMTNRVDMGLGLGMRVRGASGSPTSPGTTPWRRPAS